MADEQYMAAPTTWEKIRQFTMQIRRSIGTENDFYFPVVHFIEFALPRLDPEFELDIVSASDIPGNYAETRPALHHMRIREDVYEDALADNGRARFTLAHELGHYLMHGEGVVSLARTQSNIQVPPYARPGRQANVFAGDLLVPIPLIA